MKQNNLKGSLILCTASLIWGLSFVVQGEAARRVPSFTLNFLRCMISAVFLGLFLSVKEKRKGAPLVPKEKSARRALAAGGLVCGTLLCFGINFQQFGLAAYPAGTASEARSGFITALYVILVPATAIFTRKRISPLILAGVLIAVAGIYLLCLSDGIGGIYLGDILVFLCAVAFTAHILMIDSLGEAVDGLRISALQFLVCGLLSGILALIFEQAAVKAILDALPQILYLGILSSGVGYTLQIIGQRYAEPTVASLSMSMESVFAALGGWLIAGKSLSPRELCGCTLVFIAIITGQLPGRLKKNK